MTDHTRQALRLVATAILTLAAATVASKAAAPERSSIMTMQQDLANHEKEIHWPSGFNSSEADLFSHNALIIDASCERIWGCPNSDRQPSSPGLPC
jgi:hypothetical protein